MQIDQSFFVLSSTPSHSCDFKNRTTPSLKNYVTARFKFFFFCSLIRIGRGGSERPRQRERRRVRACIGALVPVCVWERGREGERERERERERRSRLIDRQLVLVQMFCWKLVEHYLIVGLNRGVNWPTLLNSEHERVFCWMWAGRWTDFCSVDFFVARNDLLYLSIIFHKDITIENIKRLFCQRTGLAAPYF